MKLSIKSIASQVKDSAVNQVSQVRDDMANSRATEAAAKEAGKLPEGFRDAVLFATSLFDGKSNYFVRQPVQVQGIVMDPNAPILFEKRIIGRLGDFKVEVAGQSSHTPFSHAGQWGNHQVMRATVVVSAGAYTKAYTVDKMNKKNSAKLYEAIAFVDGLRSALVRTPAATSPTDVLAQLAGLHDSGLLTDDEFAAKRLEVIGRI